MSIGWSNRLGVAQQLLEATMPLQLVIESIATEQLTLSLREDFSRVTTMPVLRGGGCEGRGEDVQYTSTSHESLPSKYEALDLVGVWTLQTFSDHLDTIALPKPGETTDDKPGFIRWALESAALDLALQQADTDLASLIGDTWHPLRFSSSMGLGNPPDTSTVNKWVEATPTTTFKLDANNEWTTETVKQLAKLGAVTTIDFKGLYTGDWITDQPGPTQYELIASGLPHAVLEDCDLSTEVSAVLDDKAMERVAWDYPITGPDDVPEVNGNKTGFASLRPGAINIKPSRFGSWRSLLETIILCDNENIPCYSGGQFELGIGRTQVQTIASLCFPEAPNDCAPSAWHGAKPGDDVPVSPLDIADHVGFGWSAPTPANKLATSK